MNTKLKLHDVPQIDGKLYLRDETDLWGFIQNGQYEPEETELIKKLVKPTDVCLDIGANIGYYTVLMAKQCKTVMAFEAEESNIDLLFQNVDTNELTNVFAYWYAVTNTNPSNQIPLYLCDKSHGMHRIFESKHCDKQIMVDAISIDSVFGGYHFDFIKMDIEGAELGALKGMVNMLKRDMPTMVMEYHPPSIREYGADPADVYNFMKNLGYDIDLVNPNIPHVSYLSLLANTDNESGGQNILCRRKKPNYNMASDY